MDRGNRRSALTAPHTRGDGPCSVRGRTGSGAAVVEEETELLQAVTRALPGRSWILVSMKRYLDNTAHITTHITIHGEWTPNAVDFRARIDFRRAHDTNGNRFALVSGGG